jgi:FkbM family methyltransferase
MLEVSADSGVTARRYRRCITYFREVVTFTWTHPANKGRRIGALGRVLRFQLRGRVLRKPTLAQLGHRSRIWAVLHRTGSSKVLYANPPDYLEMRTWQQLLRPGDLFIDVGSNIGAYAILAAEQGADVIALEPARDTFELLKNNISLNGYAVEAIQAAAGTAPGTVRFTSGQDCVNRVHPAGSVEIPMVALDTIIGARTVTGLKIDVEGFELDVLLGCSRALSEGRITLIQLEWNSTSEVAVGTDRRPVADLLTAHGYGLYRPGACGTLIALTDVSFGPDVFARLER